MATIPSPEEFARKILAIFIEFNLRAGECLPQRTLVGIWSNKGLRFDDLNAGIEYAVAQGWIERGENHVYFLTEKGFSEA